LTNILDESRARIILLCAPAGYGKTTLAREWIATRSEPVAWYRGGAEMLDVAAVARTVAETLKSVGMTERAATRVAAIAARTSNPEALGHALASSFPADQDALLVIDDYQHGIGSPSEQLFERVLVETSLRLLLVSRVRPNWLTSRMCVYGDALVVGLEELAFTEAEARSVLTEAAAPSNDHLVDQARGWPAVIGLAARGGERGNRADRSLLPGELYNFIAEDLFRGTSFDLRESLFLLALGGDVEQSVTDVLLGKRKDEDITAATSCGFLTRRTDAEIEMHPLLRAFLLTKLHELPTSAGNDYAMRALDVLARAQHWDECLNVLTEFPQSELVSAVLDNALEDLLASGRLATIRRWLTLSPSDGDAVLLLAEAEVALREGLDAHAQVIAERAAGIALADDLAARAYLVAARAAHARGDSIGARRNAQKVSRLAPATSTQINARWVEFLNAFEEQDGSAKPILESLRNAQEDTPEQALRLRHAAAFLLFEVDGDVRGTLREMELGRALMHHVSDPLVKTTFLNLYASASVYGGRYELALDLADEQMREAELSGLEFAGDHALTTKAAALVGLRQLGEAQKVLRDLDGKASASEFVRSQIALKVARLRATAGDLERAELLLREPLAESLPRASHGEWFATRALYLAALGDLDGADIAARNALASSTYLDARNLAGLAQVIVATQRETASESKVCSLLDRLDRDGHVDAVVMACRAFPLLAEIGARKRSVAAQLTRTLAGSHDYSIAKASGLAMPRELRPRGKLSKREREVYELVILGRSNREIASTLYISESTTKVHVQHIYEKLGVRSRAEAARLEADLRRDD
jgi:ATP/maltotriose-dependent transcriptional regulator MalT